MNFAFLLKKKLMVCMINTVSVWRIKIYFSSKMIFSPLVLECTYLTCPHQFWTWTARCHLKGCKIMVSPGVVQKSCGHSDWRGLWSRLPPCAWPSSCDSNVPEADTARRPPHHRSSERSPFARSCDLAHSRNICKNISSLGTAIETWGAQINRDFFQAFTYVPL